MNSFAPSFEWPRCVRRHAQSATRPDRMPLWAGFARNSDRALRALFRSPITLLGWSSTMISNPHQQAASDAGVSLNRFLEFRKPITERRLSRSSLSTCRRLLVASPPGSLRFSKPHGVRPTRNRTGPCSRAGIKSTDTQLNRLLLVHKTRADGPRKEGDSTRTVGCRGRTGDNPHQGMDTTKVPNK